jgi:hypothetical protein
VGDRLALVRARSRIDAPSGRSGSFSGLMPHNTLMTCLVISLKSTCTLTRSAPRKLAHRSGLCLPTPDRSTFPLVRGAGAVKSGLPSWLRGVRVGMVQPLRGKR